MPKSTQEKPPQQPGPRELASMRQHFARAVQNVVVHGDTDVFPFPFENHLFFDKTESIIAMLESIHRNFDGRFNNFEETLAAMPPTHESLLTPVGHTGFRRATQLDPLWNLYFLALVISIGDRIESARVPLDANVVFSYRFDPDPATPGLFRKDIGWLQFMQHSLQSCQEYERVVACDVADFYQHAGHHRLQNALDQLNVESDIPHRIMYFLKNFSGDKSYGLPIGGPAARLLSELLLNQTDRLLRDYGISFCRFSDDYHLFCSSLEDAYRRLVFLSDRLQINEGLSLQKSKTRIMTGAEFQAAMPVIVARVTEAEDPDTLGESRPPSVGRLTDARAFMRLSLRFDPYSPTAEEDYEQLKSELYRFDILGMLSRELAKSRVDVPLTRKITSAIRHLELRQKRDAVLSFLDNLDLLYPIFSNVMIMLHDVFKELDEDVSERIVATIHELISSDSHLVSLDVNLAYSLRVLACRPGPVSTDLFTRLFYTRSSMVVRRQIILSMAHWKQYYWLSDLKNAFNVMRRGERRAFIVASYMMGEEGRLWRGNTKAHFDALERLIKEWIGEKKNAGVWSVPV